MIFPKHFLLRILRVPAGGDDDLTGMSAASLAARDSGGGGDDTALLDDPNADRGDDFVSTPDEPASRTKAAPEEAVETIEEKAERLTKEAKVKPGAKPAAKPKVKVEEDGEPTEEEIAAAAAEIEAAELEAKAKAEGKVDGRSAPKIPLDRHEKILEKVRLERDALSERLKKFEGGEKVAQVNGQLNEIDTEILRLEGTFAKLTTDGEHEKAAQAMGQIRILERKSTAMKNQADMAAAIAQATESTRYDTALERIEVAFPILNPEHEDFDIEQLREVAKLSAAYQYTGETMTKALQKAVKLLVGDPDELTNKQDDALNVTPKADPVIAKAEARKRAAVAKALELKGKSPPDASKVGLNSDKAGGTISVEQVMKMSDDDFKKLPENVLAKMRGDDF